MCLGCCCSRKLFSEISETKGIPVFGSGHLNTSDSKYAPFEQFRYQTCGTPVGKIPLHQTEPECWRLGLGMEFREAFYLLCPPLCFCLWVYKVRLAFQCWRQSPWAVVEGSLVQQVWDYCSFPSSSEEQSPRLLPAGNAPKLQPPLQRV